MNTYILLRNNKESKSLTLDALRQTGLKSTDLIWVECQSVCWQHPHEIIELKALVAANNTQPVVQAESQPLESDNNSHEIIPENVVEKEMVVVEITASLSSTTKQSNGVSVLSDLHKYGGLAVTEKQYIEKKTENISIKHFSPPDEEVKEIHIKNQEQQRKPQHSILKIKLPEQFKKIAVYTGLLLTGAAVMLIINNISRKKSTTTRVNFQQPKSNKLTDTLVSKPVEMNVTPQPVNEEQELPTEEIISSPTDEKKLLVRIKKATTEEKENENLAIQDSNSGKIEKKSQEVKEIPALKPVSAEMISSKLSLNVNDYTVGSFGGIRNLEITLHNDSKYLLDKVTVEVQYLNPEGIILKTENIYFQSLSPGEKETVAVKKSKRGVKIVYKIAGVESKANSGNTAGL